MTKKIRGIVIFLSLFWLAVYTAPAAAAADKPINLYFFYGDGCPHCAKEEKFLDRLEKENNGIRVHRFETWHDRGNAELLARIGRELGLNIRGVPVLIVGEENIVGYYSDETTGRRIESIVKEYIGEGCSDTVAPIIGSAADAGQCVHGCAGGDEECFHDCGCSADTPGGTAEDKNGGIVIVPLLGEIDPRDFSLPALTIVLAAVDGFNPCAMWVLLFLINLLLGMENRRRMWTLGLAFLFSSAAVYFMFLAAWLNIILFMGFITWIRAAVALVALGSGFYHLRGWYKNREGCPVTDNAGRRLVFEKLRRVITEKKFYLALGGIVVLAALVNFVELLCSAGVPAVYVSVLTMADLPAWQYYFYFLLYILVFLLDDLLVFFAAMTALRLKAVSSRYSRQAGLIGGAVMIVIGVLLLLKPGWLMFG